MAKLYNKHNQQLRLATNIVQPTKQADGLKSAADFGAKALENISKENFLLGQGNLTNGIIESAYASTKKLPANERIQAFNQAIIDGIDNQTKNLPGNMARAIQLGTEKKSAVILKQINKDIADEIDSKLKNNVEVAANDIVGDGQFGLKSINSGMMAAFIARDEDSAAKSRDLWQQQHDKLSLIAEERDSKGNYIIGKESARNMYKDGLYGKVDAFRGQIETLDKEALKAFDDDVFQNKKDFMEAYGVDFDTYDDLERIVKNRRKAFDKSDERQIKSQNYFELSKLSNIQEDKLADIEKSGKVNSETIKLIREAKSAANDAGANPNAAFNFGDQNEGFLATIQDLQEVMNSKDDGSEDYNDRLTQAAARADITITKMKNAGLSEDAVEILRTGLTNSVVSQDFADILNTNDSTLLSEMARGAKNDFDNKMKGRLPNLDEEGRNLVVDSLSENRLTRNILGTTPDRVEEISEDTKRGMRSYAAQVFSASLVQGQLGNYEAARTIRQEGNKELIRMKYGRIIPRDRFIEMDNLIKNGKKAYITTPKGLVLEYDGMSEKDIIVRGSF